MRRIDVKTCLVGEHRQARAIIIEAISGCSIHREVKLGTEC